MEQIQKTLLYCWEVYRKSFVEVWECLGMWGRLIDALLLVGAMVGLIITQNLEPLSTLLTEYETWERIFWFSLLAIPVLALINSPRVAALQDENQKKQIEKYQQADEIAKARKITFDKIEDNKESNKMNTVSIKVYNGHEETFIGKLLLTAVDGKTLATVLELSEEVTYQRIANREWYTKTSRTIDLAYIDKASKNAFFIGENHATRPIENLGKHAITTQLVGKLGEHKIDAKEQKWILTIREDATMELKKKGRK